MKSNFFPKKIKKIGIVALASMTTECIYQNTVTFLKNSGVEVDWALPDKNRTYKKKASLFEKMWNDNSIDLIIAERGGYGSAAVCDEINWNNLVENSKPFIGYSDITAFHLAMLKYGINFPISGPMAVDLPFNLSYSNVQWSFKHVLKQIFNCPEDNIQVNDFFSYIPQSDIKNIDILKYGYAEGLLIPANLTVLASLIGTKYMLDLPSCILLLEDIAEKPYKIHRCLTQLKQSGVLKKVKGILIGHFTNCGNIRQIKEVFFEFSDLISGPVVFGINFGHVEFSLSFPFGKKVFLNLRNENSINSILERQL